MKNIQLKTVTENHGGKEVDMTTVELIKMAVNNPPQGGLTASEMKDRIKILDLLEGANGELKLEDADFQNLSKYVKETKWRIVSKFIVDFSNDFI